MEYAYQTVGLHGNLLGAPKASGYPCARLHHWFIPVVYMWFYVINDQQLGPVSEKELKDLLDRQVISGDTQVWRTGTRNWLRVDQLELAPTEPVAVTEVTPAAPLAEGWRVCAFSGQATEEKDMFQIDGYWIANQHRAEAEAYLQTGGWLPKVKFDSVPQGNLTLQHIFREAAQLFVSCAAPACTLFLLVHLPFDWLVNSMLPKLEPEEVLTLEKIPPKAALLAFASGYFVLGGILHLFRQHSRGDRIGFAEAFRAAVMLWLPMLITTFALTAMIGLGTLALIVPGLIIAVRSSLVPMALVERRMTPLAAFKHGWRITAGHFFDVFGCLVIVTLATMLPHALLSTYIGGVAHTLFALVVPASGLDVVDNKIMH